MLCVCWFSYALLHSSICPFTHNISLTNNANSHINQLICVPHTCLMLTMITVGNENEVTQTEWECKRAGEGKMVEMEKITHKIQKINAICPSKASMFHTSYTHSDWCLCDSVCVYLYTGGCSTHFILLYSLASRLCVCACVHVKGLFSYYIQIYAIFNCVRNSQIRRE